MKKEPMENKNFEFHRDWENDGMMVYTNAKTLSRYHELCRERDEIDVSKFRCFFAFSNVQLEQGKTAIRLKPEEKLVSFGGGGFGVEDGVRKYFAFLNDIENRFKTECDPQEVYCYEYNNFESFLAIDGDRDVIRLITRIWGIDTASRVKRFSAFNSLTELFPNRE